MDNEVEAKQLNGEANADLDEMGQGKDCFPDEGNDKTISEVFDSRIHLINQLGDSDLSEAADLVNLFERLSTLWEDSPCMDISQCMLNKSILDVAGKYVEADISGCLEQFLSFGLKASEWCGKNLNVMLLSVEEPQEERLASSYFQLVLNLLSFSAASFSACTRLPVMGDRGLLLLEKFLFECLSLTKSSVSEMKRIHLTASELLKVVQLVLDASVKLCKTYYVSLRLESRGTLNEGEKSSMDEEKGDTVNHVIDLMKCTINNLCELGVLAAGGGGNLVTILNVSWKGVVTLLQLGKVGLAQKINVANIILNLISLATESLRCASESWFSKPNEDISAIEAKRVFLPLKFYIINAVRISTQYPCEAVEVFKEISLCVLMISAFGISLSKETRLRASSELLIEFLEPASFHLLQTLLNSAEVKHESVLQILDWLFTDEDRSSSIHPKEVITNERALTDEIFTVSCESISKTRVLMLGRLALFLNLLKSSPSLGEEVRLGICRKLGWFIHSLVDEDAYSSVLAFSIPVLHNSGTVPQLTWQPIFSFILHALKTFTIVASSSSAFEEIEYFLLENLLHPHFLLSEIIVELLCFILRHAGLEKVNEIIDKLCSLFQYVASTEPGLIQGSPLRKMARSICIILTYAPDGTVDRFQSTIMDDSSSSSYFMYITLILEGFPLHLLSFRLQKLVNERTITAYASYIENNETKLLADNFSRSSSTHLFGEPVYALSSVLPSLIKISFNVDQIDVKTLNFANTVIHRYKSSTHSLKEHYCKLLSQVIGIISHMRHLYGYHEMEQFIMNLHSLFVVDDSAAASAGDSNPTHLYRCKPNLCVLMAGLGNMDIDETEGNKTTAALWNLCHMLLRDRHWAFAHLAITGFGYFASRTSCNQLWKFVPQDALLSFDIDTGNEANEDRFMSHFKAFLEKEVALLDIEQCTKEQQAMLVNEGMILKEKVRSLSKRMLQSIEKEEDRESAMEIDADGNDNIQIQASRKRRKLFPDEIGEGMTLLQRGLKVISDGLTLWRQQQQASSMEQQDEFLARFSQLEDVIASLTGLTGGSG